VRSKRTAGQRCRWALGGAAVSWLAATVATAAFATQPAAGRYAGQWCVTVAAEQPVCGPAEVEWRGAGRARVGISDIVYTLRLRNHEVEVTLKHGAMQIDAFTAIYEWHGTSLRFIDADKNVRYELCTEALRKPPRRPTNTLPAAPH
jgi:hypothetical protein